MYKLLLLSIAAPFLGSGLHGWMFLPFYMVITFLYILANPKTTISKYLTLTAITLSVAFINLTPFGLFLTGIFLLANWVGILAFLIFAPLIILE